MELQDSAPTQIVTLTSDIATATCIECGNDLPNRQRFDNDLQDHINHYLGHGWQLLHVGQETRSEDGRHYTTAVMGRPAGLPGEPLGQEDPHALTEDELAEGALRFLEDLERASRLD